MELWPSLAEFFVYDETVYRLLAGDSGRNDAYRRAFRKVLDGKTVVEIGPGTELVLSRLCLEAGAKKVYAIEILESTYRAAKERAAALGLADRITLIHGDARHVQLLEKADYCVSEIVGPIGGVEGAAKIIQDCRRFLHDSANMLPARTLTRIAAAHVPAEVVETGFSEIGHHYAAKTFQQLGHPFDIRVCLSNFPDDFRLSSPAPFEDLDYQAGAELESSHAIELVFTTNGSFTGFLLWLELYVDREEVIDVLRHQQSWLPVYFPLSVSGISVNEGDRFRGTVVRSLSSNGVNPDYSIEGTLERRGFPALPISYRAPHFEKRFRANSFYRKLFSRYETPASAAGPPRLVSAERAVVDVSLTKLFEEQVERTPDRVALIHGCSSGPRAQWTYRAVNEKANRLAHLLRARGVGPEIPVAVFLDRSPECVVALLAIFKAGGVYAPLDTSYPPEHLRLVLGECRPRLVLTEERLAARLPDCGAEIVCLDGATALAAPSSNLSPAALRPDHLALILYTSGSTGKPKGVASPYRQLVNRFEWLWESYPFRDGERVAQRTSATFIPSVWGMLGALMKGVPTVILPADVIKDPARLLQVLAEERVTRVDLAPVLLKAVLDTEPALASRVPDLKLWFTAGEPLTPALYERFRKAYPGAALSNDYGSTEVSGVLAFDSRWAEGTLERVPVGRPVANCAAHVLDERLKPVEKGAVGELHIGGAPVSRGYLNRPDWTAERFVPDPFSGTPGARLYNMGDLACVRPDGLIELHGRRDHQVKIRGIRVELGAVEAVLAQHAAVRECAARLHTKASGEAELVAFAAGPACTAEGLMEFLRERLPEAMVPSRVVIVDALPRTASGKIDRTKLEMPAVPASGRAAEGVRARLRQLVAEVLERAPLTEAEDEQSFPWLGVHSAAIVELARKVGAWAGREVSVTELFDHFSVAKLAAHLTATAAPVVAKREVDDDGAIAIVGYSGRFPGAPDRDTFWRNLELGTDSIREVPAERWDASRFYNPDPEAPNTTVGKWGGFLDDADQFDPLFFHCSPREARWMDPQQRLFLEECWKALEHAGYSDRAVSNRAVGVFAGVRPSDYLSERHGLGATLDASTLMGNDSAILASRVSHFLNLKGPNLSIDTSCSSSLTAIHLACRSLRTGESELALAGGVCVLTAPDFFIQATKAGMLSKTGRCRTFDADADGFVPGEGAAVVVLKTLARARRDGDRIHGIIRAIGINQDGNTGGLTVPNTLSQSELEKAVYGEAGIDPASIGYVEAHGTGTRLGDPIEVEALTKAFADFTERKRFCRIGSVKENIGHLAAAAGVAGLIKVLLALRHRRIPPNVHVRRPNPAIDFDSSPFVLAASAQEWQANGTPRRAAISSFGFSGTNAHLVVEEAPETASAGAAQKPAHLCTLSAKSETALARKRRELAAWLRGGGREARIEDVAYTLNVGRSHFRHRLWWVATSVDDLARQLDAPAHASGALAEWGARYATGEDLDWQAIHAGESRQFVELPHYPFERKRYWHKERLAIECPPMFQPRWVAAARPRAAARSADAVSFVDDSADGLLRLFRLVKSLEAERPVELTVVTRRVFEDDNPAGESLFGFCRSLIQERPAWTIRCVDIETAEDLAMAPVGLSAVRDGVCYERVLAPVTLPAAAVTAFREGGSYLIVGGAGGIGWALARHLAEKYRARCVLIGRRALAPERQRDLEAIGGMYLRGDVADESAMRDAIARAGTLHGVFHSALELNDAPLSEMDERAFTAGLRAKIDGTLALHRTLKWVALDFFVCFSSVQAFLGNAGQSNYGAACAFQDAWARAASRTEAYPVQTIDWGFWGEVGAVASEGFRKLWASRGVESIRVEEGLEAIERVLASRVDHVVVVKADAAFLASLGAAPAATENWVAERLQGAFASLGVLAARAERHTISELKRRLRVAPRHERLFGALIALLAEAGIVREGGSAIEVLRDVRPTIVPDDVRGRLVEMCLARFPELLRGEVTPQEVLFPDSSTRLVEGLYEGLPETDAIRDEVVRLLSAASGPVRILEIGAGTGSTSAVVLEALKPFADRVRYVFSDVSAAFLAHGRRRFAASHPFVEFTALDIENPPAGQLYEIVIAANVLHATRDIRRTLGHVRSLLKPSGSLLLHEQTTLEPFLTVTFGWLDGWWRFEDTRMQNGPLLCVEQWKAALESTGFGAIAVEGSGLFVARNGAAEPVTQRIVAAMRRVLELELADIDPDKPFVDYGVDSILAQALVNTLNRDLGCALKASDLYNHPSVRALSQKLGDVAAPAAAVARVEPRREDGRIAIIGMSGRFPGADNVDAFWEMLAAGRSAITEVPESRWDAAAHYDPELKQPGKTNSKWGGFLSQIDCFDAAFFKILPIEAPWMDPQQRLFLEEAWRALEDAGYPDRALNGKKVGVFAGCKEGDYSRLFPVEQTNPYYAIGSNNSILAARISYTLNLKGPSLAVDTACSSALVAIHLACERLRSHPDEMALAGGVSVMCTPHTHLLLGKGGMLSPVGRCNTFSEDADGFVPGEAVGVVVLKPLGAALRDRDPIRAVIAAGEMNQDGRTNGITAPNAASQAALEREVYAASGIPPESVGYVETHGTGTKLGDPIEIEALSEVFGAGCALGSVKTNIGHALAAAGIASVVKVVASLEHGKIAPTLNLGRLNEALAPMAEKFTFPAELQDWPSSGGPRRAAVSSFGFSGTNVHMVVEEAPAKAATIARAPAFLIPLSAKTAAALGRKIGDLLRWVRQNRFDLADVAYTLLRGRSHFGVRAAVVARDEADLVAELERLRPNPSTEGAAEQPALKQWGASVVEELRQGTLSSEIHRERLLAMADLYMQGYGLDWDRLMADGSGRRISLPTYPFHGESYWVGSRAVERPRRVAQVLAQSWRASASTRGADTTGTIVILGGRDVAECLFEGRDVVFVSSAGELARYAGAVSGVIDLTALDPVPQWDEAIWTFLQTRVEESRGGRLKLLKATVEPSRLAGLYRVLGAEYPHVDSRVLDTDDPRQLKAQILAEWQSAPPPFGSCRYRAGARLIPELAPVASVGSEPECSSDGVLLITGGTRGVGASMAEHFVARGVRKLAILGREPLPASGPKADRLRVLEAHGAQIEIYTGPLTDLAALAQFRDRIHRNLGRVFGVLHCAGVARTEHPAFIRKSLDDLRAVCEPKIEGLHCLDEVFGGEPLSFFVLFSSVAAAIPSLGSGQSDYATANAYMDAFAEQRFAEGKRHYRSVQWPNWDGVGMGGATSAAYDATGLLSHTVAEGFRLFEQALAAECAVTLPCISGGELRWPQPTPAPRRDDWLGELFARELKLNGARLDPHVSFAEQGIDSILMAELARAIERELGVSLPASLLFEHTTLAALERHLAGERPAAAVVAKASAARSNDVAVIGLSCRFPGAPDASSLWELLRQGRSGISAAPRDGRYGGFVEDVDLFDPAFFRLSIEDAADMDPHARLLLEEGARALYDAGYGERGLDGRTVGVYVGARPFCQDNTAANLSRFFNFAGPSLVVDTACSSALVGMHMAVRALQHGEIEYALVASASLLLDDTAHRLFESRNLLRPDGVFHIFDRRADGVVLGEGACAVLLKPLDAAMRDGDRVLGVIRGIAVNNNGRTAGPNAPNFEAQKEVMAAALRESGKRADEVAEIEASGAGSVVADLLELKAIEAVFGGGGRPPCYLGSVKANVGHLLSAAGLASFVKAVLSLARGEHPPFLSANELPLHFDFERAGIAFTRQSRPWPGARVACVASFPDGGTNCCVVLESYAGASTRQPLAGPLFHKRSLKPGKAVAVAVNGKGDDFWGLTE